VNFPLPGPALGATGTGILRLPLSIQHFQLPVQAGDDLWNQKKSMVSGSGGVSFRLYPLAVGLVVEESDKVRLRNLSFYITAQVI